ncbi:similar to An01g09970 [Aspergillus luchuensis]|uniref:Similar to An01g09970 n=1 Tax=Aspergillus kawachii TaxID=1069201 RepID=A0A146FM02_ASPKA|nr:similar to An01g09970 [Aspergillus luchuensis]
MAELVPYFDGMQQGQGYDGFQSSSEIQSSDAVTITPGQPESATYDLFYSSERIDDYTKLAQSLEISAGAAISGWGQSSQIDASYLDRLRYLIVVADFIRGGQYFARVSISAVNKSTSQEIRQASEVAFSMYGVTGSVTNEVRSAVETINRHSRVTVWIHTSGGGGRSGVIHAEPHDGEDSPLFAIKEGADNFYQELREGKHRYRRFALLWRYTNVPNFNNAFTPFDYAFANQREEYGLHMNYRLGIFYSPDFHVLVPVQKFINGREQQAELYEEGANILSVIRTKEHQVQAVNENPEEINSPISYPIPEDYKKLVLLAIRTVTMIAQERTLDNGSFSDIALPTLQGNARTLFKFQTYDFDTGFGNTVVSFGRRDSSFICLSGQRVSDGYREESVFWAFEDPVEEVSEQQVHVASMRTRDLLLLSRTDPGPRPLFTFYAKSSW